MKCRGGQQQNRNKKIPRRDITGNIKKEKKENRRITVETKGKNTKKNEKQENKTLKN